MGAIFSASFAAVAVTAQQDFFELNVAATCAAIIHSIEIFQTSDFGDAQAEILPILIKTGATTSGSGGSNPTIMIVSGGNATARSTVEANNTTKASAGTIIQRGQIQWNVAISGLWLPTPKKMLELQPSARLTVELAQTPTDALTVYGELVFEEIG